MGDGAKRKAPCGHTGEVVIGTYVECRRCDKEAIPSHIDPERTEPMWIPSCPACHSTDIEEFETDIDAALWFMGNWQHPSGNIMPPQGSDWHCWTCGRVFARPR